MDEFDTQKETLENELQTARDPSSVNDGKAGTSELDDQKAQLDELFSQLQIQDRNKL